MNIDFNVEDLVFESSKDGIQFGGYTLKNKFSENNTPLFKNYSNGVNNYSIPAGLYMINSKNEIL